MIRLALREIGSVLYFGIDEISRRNGHMYCTNVYDLKEKRLLWTGEGRDKSKIDRKGRLNPSGYVEFGWNSDIF